MQELASAGAEYCGQRIGRHPWMVQRDNTIFRHGVSLLLGDREASSPPTIRHLLLSARHPLSAIAHNKTLVTQRMKRSGMRWRIAGGQAVLTFRALIKSARFDRAWKAIIGATDTPANDNINPCAVIAIAA